MRPRLRRDVPAGELFIAVAALVLAAGFVLLAFDYRGFAREMPLVIGVPTTLLALLNLARMLVRFETPVSTTVPSEPPARPSAAPADEPGPDQAGSLAYSPARPYPGYLPFLWIAVIALLWYLFGVLVACVVPAVLMPRYYESWPWKRSLLVGGAITVVLSGLLGFGFGFDVLGGVVWDWL